MDNSTARFEKSKFTNAPFAKKIVKPWGYEIHWVPIDKPYMGKFLHLNAGARFSLQYHDGKLESWFLIAGQAKIIWDDQNGNLIETQMENGKGYSCVPGQRHRIFGITDCDVIEVSTPEAGTTYRLEDDYGRPDETPDQRKKERLGTP